MQSTKTVRIGGASGFWGDSMVGAPQLVESGEIDYLVFDYLAETTMAILVGVRAKKPEMGYATDFVDLAMKAVLAKVLAQGIKVVANAGGVNPHGCADALRVMAQSMGLHPKIAVVTGDDVMPHYARLSSRGQRDMFTNAPLPEKALSANAYLGAFPIAQALAAGADIVITGRGVDSAVTLGPLIHEFGWAVEDYDLLAAGSLAGHIIECGCQATGGLFTDWQKVPDWANIGYPIIECAADGSFELYKPTHTGGLIAPACVAEQLLYEIGDPAAYALADVVCDFREVRLEAALDGDNRARVRVSGARGRAPSSQYKVSATRMDGFRCSGAVVLIGEDAAAKAIRTGQAVIERCEQIFKRLGLSAFSHTDLAILGAETLYGAAAKTSHVREVWLRITASHAMKQALEIFAREIAPAGTSWAPGTTGPALARPSVTPAIKQFSFLIEKTEVEVRVAVDGKVQDVWVDDAAKQIPELAANETPLAPPPYVDELNDFVEVPLMRLAWARSGDKGDISNIGVIARVPEMLPLLWTQLTPQSVSRYFSHLVKGQVQRFYLPGISAINFVMYEALDGGGPSSHRMDPLGKGMAQILLAMPVRVPKSLVIDF
jgi:Acyclic terpene utilisation family protein AtuA